MKELKIMRKNIVRITCIILIQLTFVSAQIYPDQHYVYPIDSIVNQIETNDGLQLSSDGAGMILQDSVLQGYITLKPGSSEFMFNRGLPSWNGYVPDENSAFLIQMRFPSGSGWSSWLTAGYWKEFLWTSYGPTSYSGGYIHYDYVKLYSYMDRWQFRIVLKRTSLDSPSPEINKISFFVSDTRTTDNLNLTSIVNDNPQAIFIDTQFIHQYSVDSQIGGSICSPTSVAMILRSFGIEVDPYDFAVDTYDPIHHMFGIWPRVVQNAHEYGLDGSVTRYRSWSQAREVLAAGGRIAMSVGPPLYSGHLMMLAGFTQSGTPIVHDPAKSNGYAYQFSKYDLSRSWFEKGGISYTFFPLDSTQTDIQPKQTLAAGPEDFRLYQNYPNPFNHSTRIEFYLSRQSNASVKVFDGRGRLVEVIYNKETSAGYSAVSWDAVNLAAGMYYLQLTAGNFNQVIRAVLVK